MLQQKLYGSTRPGTQATSATRLSRRAALTRGAAAALAGVGLLGLPTPGLAGGLSASAAAWGAFRERFVRGGRIIDNGNGGVSHSEGQGTALLAAAFCGDRQMFDDILDWTRSTLSRPYDHLHAWRFRPTAAVQVDDPNNATDGDLLIAWSLFVAAGRWDHAPYRTLALAMTRDILNGLVATTTFGTTLMPGASGFRDRTSLTVNPSYYVFPAIQRLAREMPDPRLERLSRDGMMLLRAARFGRWGLPPDWLTLLPNGKITPAEKWPTRFSFDAVRVPLYMCWGGFAQDQVVEAVHSFWSRPGQTRVPAWIDLNSEEQASYNITPGVAAIRHFVAEQRSGADTTLHDTFSGGIPPIAAANDYYSAALILQVCLAKDDTAARMS